jgi:hypothetical protein
MRWKLCMMAGLVLALVAPVLAQVTGPGRGHGIGGTRPAPATQEGEKAATLTEVCRRAESVKVTGQVESLAVQPGRVGRIKVQTAVLKTRDGSLTVHLGPVFYVHQQQFPLKVGDTWEVTGFKTTLGQKPVLIARDVKMGGHVLKLRDQAGKPLWRGKSQGPEKSK